MTILSDLAALDEDPFDSVLCVVAHPDDIEYGVAAAVTAWTGASKTGRYFLFTRGGAGVDTMDSVDAAPHARVARAALLSG
ncbi:hypothetical protein [Janibacter alittae]|uniref:PIG-L family deacetylase n=1 Tax=Janibacter alittae TaxID=3115209 RepID=A0ABZ2MLC2_9MICO